MIREATGISRSGIRPLYEEVVRISRGNPFFVLETLQTFLEKKILQREPGSGRWTYDPEHLKRSAISTNLLDLILRRIEQLPAETRTVLSVTSAIGRQFDFEFLQLVAGVEEHELLDRLDEMIHLQLIEEAQSGEHAYYHFVHDKIRQAIYEQIPRQEKCTIHDRIGQQMEKAAEENDLEMDFFELAHHFCNGLDSSKALKYSMKAGDQARSQNANREAMHYYNEALSRLDGGDAGGGGDAEKSAYIQEQLGDLYSILAEFDESLVAYQSAESLEQSKLARARFNRKIGAVLNKKGDVPRAIEHLENALTLLGKKPRTNRASILFSIFRHSFRPSFSGAPSPGAKELDKKQRRYETEKELCRVYGDLWYLYFFTNIPRSFEAHLAHKKFAEKTGDPSLLAEAYRVHGFWLAHLRRFRKARAYLQQSMEIYSSLEDSLGGANTKSSIGYLDLCQGRLDEAAEQLESAVPELESAEAHWELGTECLHLAVIFWAKGDFPKALGYLEKLERLVEDGRDDRGQVLAYGGLSITHFLMGDVDRGASYLEKVGKICEHSAHPFILAFFYSITGFHNLIREEWSEACEILEKALDVIRKHTLYSFDILQPWVIFLLAYLKRAEHAVDEDEKKACLLRVRTVLWMSRFLVHGFPTYSGQWWILKGLYLRQKGREGSAERAIQKGLAMLQEIQAHPLPFLAEGDLSSISRMHQTGETGEELRLRADRDGLSPEPQKEPPSGRTDSYEPPHIEDEPTLSPESLKLGSLLKATQLVTSSLDFKEVLARIIDLSLTSLGAERGFLMLYEQGNDRHGEAHEAGTGSSLQVSMARNMEQKTLEENEFAFSRSVIKEVERTGKAIVITDAQKDSRFDGSESVVLKDLRSILVVPLMDQSRPIGLLYLDNHLVSHLFTEGDLGFIRFLASFAVIAIKNARAYEEISRQRDEIQRLEQKLLQEVVYLKEEIHTEHNFEEMVGSCPAMQKVFRFIEQAAPLDQPVLIQGETGTGKELVARAVHRRSPRGDKPIIKVNCAAIPEGLLESELFGHEKGAFTGAIQRKIGRFELAEGGTIFLDEIGEMSPNLQAKLLRILEDKEFERVGGTQTLKTDARIISTTNRNLEEEVQRETFREDLFYRLNVLPIRVPPLRKRTEDIPLLLSYFIDKFGKKFNKDVKSVDVSTMDAIQRYPWPGNIRELKHLVERAIALSDSPDLNLAPMVFIDKSREESYHDMNLPMDYHLLVQTHKRAIIHEAIRRVGGSKKEAARLLGISPSYLSQLLRKLSQ